MCNEKPSLYVSFLDSCCVQTVLCETWLEEGECNRPGCSFAHGQKELAQAAPGNLTHTSHGGTGGICESWRELMKRGNVNVKK
jgi:hypothetical protein